MISIIEIKNFRCFEHTKISGFKRVNLIGGLNNSGKTALLEALYLNNSPDGLKCIEKLREIREESLEFLKNSPEKAWYNFFLNKKINLSISSDAPIKSKVFLNSGENLSGEPIEYIISKYNIEINSQSTLLLSWQDSKNTYEFILCSSSKGIRLIDKYPIDNFLNYEVSDIVNSSFSPIAQIIPSIHKTSNRELAKAFDKAAFDGKDDRVLKAIKIVDDSIEQARTFNFGEPILYLKRKDSEYLPISLFGTSVSRITDFILKIINDESRILLIDEIENGIHYTNQPKLWEMLFKLAIEFDIQIFATTHSIEMIRAFSETAKNFDEDMAAYIEMTRSVKSGRIVGIARDMDQLDYEINQDIGVRGE